MTRDLASSVVVITGASSGIGSAAGHAFARQGSRLVLGARSEVPLQAVAVPTDVRDESAVEALAARAVERFGRHDVRVNGAGVIAYGRFEDVPGWKSERRRELARAFVATLRGAARGVRGG